MYEGSRLISSMICGRKTFIGMKFPDIESFLRYMRDSFVRLTDMPCILPEGSTEGRARAMIERMAEVDALEILEDAG